MSHEYIPYSIGRLLLNIPRSSIGEAQKKQKLTRNLITYQSQIH